MSSAIAQQKIRIRLKAFDRRMLDLSCEKIIETADNTSATAIGPIPLPTKKLNVVTRKSPCGNGTETYEKWQMRMHRRIFDINADDKAIRQLMRLKIPDDVYIELSLK